VSPRAKAVYAAVVVFVTIIAGFIGNVLYTNHVDERRARSDRANTIARQKQAEQSKIVVCALINANVAADKESPPQTPAGKNKAEAWKTLKTQFGC
jgi:uncharacterized membrane protein YcjF (UPF0283 family)